MVLRQHRGIYTYYDMMPLFCGLVRQARSTRDLFLRATPLDSTLLKVSIDTYDVAEMHTSMGHYFWSCPYISGARNMNGPSRRQMR